MRVAIVYICERRAYLVFIHTMLMVVLSTLYQCVNIVSMIRYRQQCIGVLFFIPCALHWPVASRIMFLLFSDDSAGRIHVGCLFGMGGGDGGWFSFHFTPGVLLVFVAVCF